MLTSATNKHMCSSKKSVKCAATSERDLFSKQRPKYITYVEFGRTQQVHILWQVKDYMFTNIFSFGE